MTFELILTTESKVVACNIKDFEAQANQYLATLTTEFETDDDFAKAKDEVKELKEIETKIRAAIKSTTNGEIAELITTAENIAERFRAERLSREKLVKTKEDEIKQSIISQAFERIMAVRGGYESDVSLALERNISKQDIHKRLAESTKRRSTLATLTKAVNAEETAILAELASESARISARRKLIPIQYEYLFKDCLALIAGAEDLEQIIQQRIADEEKREAEIKAKVEQEAIAEAKVIADEMEQQAIEKPQEFAKAETTEPVNDFLITIRLTQTTQAQAIEIARSLKARFGDCVSLNKAK